MSPKIGQCAIVFVHLPQRERFAAGVLLLDHTANSLSVRLRETIPTDDETAILVWNGLSQKLLEISQQAGGEATLAWLEDTASHSIRIASRKKIQFADAEAALEELYQKHVLQTCGRAAGGSGSCPLRTRVTPPLGHFTDIPDNWTRLVVPSSNVCYLCRLKITSIMPLRMAKLGCAVTGYPAMKFDHCTFVRASTFWTKQVRTDPFSSGHIGDTKTAAASSVVKTKFQALERAVEQVR